MEYSRRDFLKIASCSALGVGLGTGLGASISGAVGPGASTNPPSSARRWGMVIDTRKLVSLEPMIEACVKAHNIPRHSDEKREIKWIWGEAFQHAFPIVESRYFPERIRRRTYPVLCNHCEKPPCVKVCPTKATFKRDDGIVVVDFHRCIGCRYCMAACPYGARSFNYLDPRGAIREEDYNPAFPTRMRGVVEKCNFCAERIAVGKAPACVEASGGAVVFGDLDDPESDVRRLLSSEFAIRRKESLGTGPSVYYIL